LCQKNRQEFQVDLTIVVHHHRQKMLGFSAIPLEKIMTDVLSHILYLAKLYASLATILLLIKVLKHTLEHEITMHYLRQKKELQSRRQVKSKYHPRQKVKTHLVASY